MARSIDQIIQELDASYNPQRQAIQQRIDALPAQADAEIEGLKATQTQAFDNILSGARQRGVGAWGIPMEEQAKYTSSQFLPAVARVRQSTNETKMSLFDALNGINTDQRKYAMGVQQQELDREEQVRQANMAAAAQRAQSANFSSLFGGGQTKGASSPLQLPGAALKDTGKGGAGGFNFSFGNKPISAVGFAQVNNLNPADIIYSMASSGDPYAAQAYKEIVANKGKITSQLAQKYYALFWGTNMLPQQSSNKSNNKPAPAAPTVRQNTQIFKGSANPLGI